MITELRAADWSTPAVVLKFDPNVMHHGGLGVIRSLGRLGVPVYGVHERPWAPAASSRYLPGRCFWRPHPDDRRPDTAPGCSAWPSRIGRPAVLYPDRRRGRDLPGRARRGAARGVPVPRPAAGPAPAAGGQVLAVQLCRDWACPARRPAGLVTRGGRRLRRRRRGSR